MMTSFKYRIYPNRSQQEQIERTFGCCRWVYNRCNALYAQALEDGVELLAENDFAVSILAWKKENPWLAEADSMALRQAARDCCRAWSSFSRKPKYVGKPHFKSKREGRQAYRTSGYKGAVHVTIPKCGKAGRICLPKLGEVRARISRPPCGRVVSATVVREATGMYYVFALCKHDAGSALPSPDSAPEVTGVDAGLKHLLVTSEGEVFESPKATRRFAAKLERERRRLARKKKGSANWTKQRRKVARVHAKAANIRRDALHKATTTIVRESQAVAVENLNVAGMARNRKLAYAVHDAGMGAALRMLEYKCERAGRPFVKVGRFFASSQVCSACGAANPKVKDLSVRSWECPACGAAHDRDVNAARNIAKEGARLLALEEDGTAGRAGTEAISAA